MYVLISQTAKSPENIRELTTGVEEKLSADRDLLTSVDTHLDVAPHHWTRLAGFRGHHLTHASQAQVLRVMHTTIIITPTSFTHIIYSIAEQQHIFKVNQLHLFFVLLFLFCCCCLSFAWGFFFLFFF